MIEHCAQNFFASKELSTGIMELVFCLISNAGNIKNVAMIENGNPISSISDVMGIWTEDMSFWDPIDVGSIESLADFMGF
ncbi:MAG: hypothetical protein K9G11_03665 [Rickettsiaceae bacterium]|nr:hypothetical protein [Rickettsiaceae bacterium]